MKYKWRFVLIAAVISLICVITACGKSTNNAGQQTGNTTGNTTGGTTQGGTTGGTTAGGGTSTANAEAIAKANCIACHGNALDGNGDAKKNLTKVGSRLTQEQIATTITNGRNAMPSFKGKLKDDEIASLSAWLAAKK